MKDSKKQKTDIRITEGSQPTSGAEDAANVSMRERLKKPIIFGLMGIICLCSLYLIFKPKNKAGSEIQQGLNQLVPQATDTGMPADKQKAYEQEMLEQKALEKRNAMLTLSEYWQNEGDSTAVSLQESIDERPEQFGSIGKPNNMHAAVHNYRDAQQALNSFYREDPDNTSMRKEIDALRERLAEKEEENPGSRLQNQMALMEKSYEMAAKYLPGQASAEVPTAVPGKPPIGFGATTGTQGKETIVSFVPDRNTTISKLQREITDSAFAAAFTQERNLGFHSGGTTKTITQPRNSVRACIHETQTVSIDGVIRLRLLESARTPNYIIPKGTILTAIPSLSTGRLTLKINSIELSGSIIPVEIIVYDLDGQAGLYVPFSPEIGAAQGILANMGTTAGSNVTLNSSATQQITSDLTKSVVNGISGYFAKKVTTPKVTVKAGHQLFLLSKK